MNIFKVSSGSSQKHGDPVLADDVVWYNPTASHIFPIIFIKALAPLGSENYPQDKSSELHVMKHLIGCIFRENGFYDNFLENL